MTLDPLPDLLIEMHETQVETRGRLERMVQVGIIKPDSITANAEFCTVIVKTDERSVEYEDVRLPFFLHLVDLCWQLIDVHQTREQVVKDLTLGDAGEHSNHVSGTQSGGEHSGHEGTDRRGSHGSHISGLQSDGEHGGHVSEIVYPTSGNTPNAIASVPAREKTVASDTRSKPYPRPDSAVPASVFNPVLGGRTVLIYVDNGLEEAQRYIIAVY